MNELLHNARHENHCGFSRNDERRAISRKPQNLTIILKGDFIALLPSLRGDLSSNPFYVNILETQNL